MCRNYQQIDTIEGSVQKLKDKVVQDSNKSHDATVISMKNKSQDFAQTYTEEAPSPCQGGKK